MKKLPEIFGSLGANIAYVLTLSLFFSFFVPVFRPFEMTESLDMGRDLFFFNVTIMMCIILGTLLITRTIFFLLFKYLGNNWWGYVGICIFELTAINYLEALYLTLMTGGETTYFTQVAVCLQYTFLILLIPITGFTFVLLIINKADKPVPQSPSIVRFYDNKKQVKFAISRDAVLYISAEENYIRIHYFDESGIKDYLLRSSMTAIAPLAEKHGFCRCHRSYYVNPSHIKALIKEKTEQISIELGSSGIKIPVSRIYYPDISKKI
ncbi:MAG: LytTR family DNA-binding domain-containing protein [Bacteroidia bacterium]|nr:LytTR family DNA-binding domain-containing protein [Bacteroidia bacterium]